MLAKCSHPNMSHMQLPRAGPEFSVVWWRQARANVSVAQMVQQTGPLPISLVSLYISKVIDLLHDLHRSSLGGYDVRLADLLPTPKVMLQVDIASAVARTLYAGLPATTVRGKLAHDVKNIGVLAVQMLRGYALHGMDTALDELAGQSYSPTMPAPGAFPSSAVGLPMAISSVRGPVTAPSPCIQVDDSDNFGAPASSAPDASTRAATSPAEPTQESVSLVKAAQEHGSAEAAHFVLQCVWPSHGMQPTLTQLMAHPFCHQAPLSATEYEQLRAFAAVHGLPKPPPRSPSVGQARRAKNSPSSDLGGLPLVMQRGVTAVCIGRRAQGACAYTILDTPLPVLRQQCGLPARHDRAARAARQWSPSPTASAPSAVTTTLTAEAGAALVAMGVAAPASPSSSAQAAPGQLSPGWSDVVDTQLSSSETWSGADATDSDDDSTALSPLLWVRRQLRLAEPSQGALLMDYGGTLAIDTPAALPVEYRAQGSAAATLARLGTLPSGAADTPATGAATADSRVIKSPYATSSVAFGPSIGSPYLHQRGMSIDLFGGAGQRLNSFLSSWQRGDTVTEGTPVPAGASRTDSMYGLHMSRADSLFGPSARTPGFGQPPSLAAARMSSAMMSGVCEDEEEAAQLMSLLEDEGAYALFDPRLERNAHVGDQEWKAEQERLRHVSQQAGMRSLLARLGTLAADGVSLATGTSASRPDAAASSSVRTEHLPLVASLDSGTSPAVTVPTEGAAARGAIGSGPLSSAGDHDLTSEVRSQAGITSIEDDSARFRGSRMVAQETRGALAESYSGILSAGSSGLSDRSLHGHVLSEVVVRSSVRPSRSESRLFSELTASQDSDHGGAPSEPALPGATGVLGGSSSEHNSGPAATSPPHVRASGPGAPPASMPCAASQGLGLPPRAQRTRTRTLSTGSCGSDFQLEPSLLESINSAAASGPPALPVDRVRPTSVGLSMGALPAPLQRGHSALPPERPAPTHSSSRRSSLQLPPRNIVSRSRSIQPTSSNDGISKLSQGLHTSTGRSSSTLGSVSSSPSASRPGASGSPPWTPWSKTLTGGEQIGTPATAMSSFIGAHDNELCLVQGDEVRVLQVHLPDWCLAVMDNPCLVPAEVFDTVAMLQASEPLYDACAPTPVTAVDVPASSVPTSAHCMFGLQPGTPPGTMVKAVDRQAEVGSIGWVPMSHLAVGSHKELDASTGTTVGPAGLVRSRTRSNSPPQLGLSSIRRQRSASFTALDSCWRLDVSDMTWKRRNPDTGDVETSADPFDAAQLGTFEDTLVVRRGASATGRQSSLVYATGSKRCVISAVGLLSACQLGSSRQNLRSSPSGGSPGLQGSASAVDGAYPDYSRLVLVHTDFHSESPTELSLAAGELVRVEQETDSGWWFGQSLMSGAQGWFPMTYTSDLQVPGMRDSDGSQGGPEEDEEEAGP